MNISAPFIHRPVATTLLTVAIALAGDGGVSAAAGVAAAAGGFPDHPVSATAARRQPARPWPSSVATPLERQFGRIAGVTEMTSTSTSVDQHHAAVRSEPQHRRRRARRAGGHQCRARLSAGQSARAIPPIARSIRPTRPIMILALTSDVYDRAQMYDAASSIMAQKLSQIQGVGQVMVGGSALPAVRVELNPMQLNSYGIGLEQVAHVLQPANANQPKGQIPDRMTSIAMSERTISCLRPRTIEPLVVGYQQRRARAALRRR